MIDFERLERDHSKMRANFMSAEPFEHIVIDDFCHANVIDDALHFLPDAISSGHKKSNDYIFAKNKFEKSEFDTLTPLFADLKAELTSSRFETWLTQLTNQKIFIDPDFHGGGLHQGGPGSFLDMHADFNYHPNHLTWFRNVNILLYLNKNWKQEYGGHLKLVDGRQINGKPVLIEPIFNRAVIMFTREHTLHGYDAINFPEGSFRSSIAAYGYTETGKEGALRTTVWQPENGSSLKRVLGRHMHKLIKIKSMIFGSGTTKNR
jgi:Rps23 Pro-64 3,4-dihydroxylase Tpa1-like proline 4-hydroxylase